MRRVLIATGLTYFILNKVVAMRMGNAVLMVMCHNKMRIKDLRMAIARYIGPCHMHWGNQ